MQFRLKDGGLFGFAGLWETWGDKEKGEPLLHSCTIITTTANENIVLLHDRMPVILNPELEEAWLDPSLDDAEELVQFLKPFDAKAMETYEVSTKVNTPAFDAPACIEPSGDQPPQPDKEARNSA